MPRLFGTNGIRGIVNDTMNAKLAMEVGMAIATYLENKGTVLIGTDTRLSKDMLKSAVTSALLSGGCNVVDVGTAPTPAIQYMIPRMGANLGVIITASHNPPQWNGIKCADADGTELAREKEEVIEDIYFKKAFKTSEWDTVGKLTSAEVITTYIDGIVEKINVQAIKEANMKVVLDCANGAASYSSPYLFERLGCQVITLNAHPQGTFPGHRSEPTPDNLQDLMAITRESGADLGIAHDGDADRVIFIDEKGQYVFGDKSLALVAKQIVNRNNGGIVITGINSSQAVEDVVTAEGGKIIYTQVGSPIVARKMMETGAIFGGEENGGLMFPEHQYCRDGAMTAAKLLEIIALSGKSASTLFASLPQYQQYKVKTACPNEKKERALEVLAGSIQGKEVITMDGVKIIEDEGWILVRPSGTEEIYRIYTEAKDLGTAKSWAEDYKNKIEQIIARL